MTTNPAGLRAIAWQDAVHAQLEALADGELLPMPEPPPVRVGLILRSNERRYPDGDKANFRGGVVIDAVDGVGRFGEPGGDEVGWRCVEIHRGRIHYITLPESEIDWLSYTAMVMPHVLTSMRQFLAADMARNRKADHTTALLRINAALANPWAE